MKRTTLTLDGNNFEAIAWKGPGGYDKYGQLMSAIKLDAGVYMVDRSRMISYYLPDCALDSYDIMYRYNYNKDCMWEAPSMKWVDRDNPGLNKWDLEKAMNDFALTLVA